MCYPPQISLHRCSCDIKCMIRSAKSRNVFVGRKENHSSGLREHRMAVHDGKKPEKKAESSSEPLIKKLTTEKVIREHNRHAVVDGRMISSETSNPVDIVNIKLSGRGIKSIESLDLPSLRRLDLSNNSLNRLKGLQGCPQVTYLTAAGNELTGEGLDGVRPLRDLKVWNVSGNRVKRIAPATFAHFRELQALVMNNNELVEVPPSWFKKGLLTLNTLVLSHNQIKSLANSGLGRLTYLTKLSISHNTLTELPDLSACSALGELRAAHNMISSLPATLAKNAALRILDVGHNNIEDWSNLEKIGKVLTALVQLTLAGNPVCVNGNEDAEEGDYVRKVRSLFPSLKVRDGKRVRMKKSHVYYERRAAASRESAHVTGDAERPEGLGADGVEVVPRKRRKSKKTGDEGDPGRVAAGDGDVEVANEERAKKRNRASVDNEGEQESRKARVVAKRKSKALSSADGNMNSEEGVSTDIRGEKQKKQKKQKEGKELVTAVEETAQSRKDGDVNGAVDAGAKGPPDVADGDVKGKKRKKSKKASASASPGDAVDSRSTAESTPVVTAAVARGKGTREEDPYSSSEELPPVKPPNRTIQGQQVTGAGDTETSGVIGVVITSKGKRILKEGGRSKVSKAWAVECPAGRRAATRQSAVSERVMVAFEHQGAMKICPPILVDYALACNRSHLELAVALARTWFEGNFGLLAWDKSVVVLSPAGPANERTNFGDDQSPTTTENQN